MKIALSFLALTLSLSTAFAQTLPSTANLELQNADIENFGLKGTKIVALTFDDGPGVGTAKILDLLKQYNVKATFFSVGQMAGYHPAMLDRIVAEGHVLANHSFDHPALSKLSADQVIAEIKKTHEILAPHMKPGQRLYFRAPYGDWSPDVAEKVNRDPELHDYIGPIYWNIGKMISRDENGKLTNAGDWACWRKAPKGLSVDECLEGYLAKVESEKGGVILMHDIHRQTAEMFEKLLPILIERGYKFVTMDELSTLDLYETMQPVQYDSAGKIKNF
jgi:peptidoglycan/xylan/chitin deacetylase (PgdA/CDA1 family)